MARHIEEVEIIAQRTIALLRERIPVAEAYLFGSSIEGTADEESDIDIAAFSPDAETMPLNQRIGLIVQVERQIDAPIELHLFGVQSLAEARPTNFFGYLRNHGKLIA